MKHVLKIFGFLVMIGVVLSVTACGKMSDPRPVQNSGYPHIYPKK